MKDKLFNGKFLFSVLAILICLTFTTVSYSQDNGEAPNEAAAEAPQTEGDAEGDADTEGDAEGDADTD